MNFRFVLAVVVSFLFANISQAQTWQFKYTPAPVDNPIKGLVPYVTGMPWLDPHLSDQEKTEYFKKYDAEVFPHSMEFHYFALKDLMTGDNQFDWSELEKWLGQSSARGCQLTFRVYLEYPSQESGVPKFLTDQGLKITKWKHDGHDQFAPDYNDPKLQKAVDQFLVALGKKYDGDPRIGCITMGILGHWGEWHSYPRDDLFASKEYQKHVMDQFAKNFTKTKVLMRYPAGDDDYHHAKNSDSDFGYHDDSFAFATVKTGKEDDSWFFLAAMDQAGTLDAWKTRMIGGEIRPEVWGCIFDEKSCAPAGQEFDKCVQQTHATWLMDTGMFGEGKGKETPERIANAKKAVAKMGYELHIKSITVKQGGEEVSFEIENRGVAPFYYDWPAKIGVIGKGGLIQGELDGPIGLPSILPGAAKTIQVELHGREFKEGDRIAIRVPNPMKGGKPLRFANATTEIEGELWVATPK